MGTLIRINDFYQSVMHSLTLKPLLSPILVLRRTLISDHKVPLWTLYLDTYKCRINGISGSAAIALGPNGSHVLQVRSYKSSNMLQIRILVLVLSYFSSKQTTSLALDCSIKTEKWSNIIPG